MFKSYEEHRSCLELIIIGKSQLYRRLQLQCVHQPEVVSRQQYVQGMDVIYPCAQATPIPRHARAANFPRDCERALRALCGFVPSIYLYNIMPDLYFAYYNHTKKYVLYIMYTYGTVIINEDIYFQYNEPESKIQEIEATES